MGNASSRVRRHNGVGGCTTTTDHGVLLFLYRSWAVFVPDFRNGRYTDRRRNARNNETNQDATDASDWGSQYSFCSCSQCQRDHAFSDCSSDDFGSIMAPNSDESGRLVALSKNKSGWSEDNLAKEKQRPPIYNPEDYAISLKKWGRRPVAGAPGLYSTQIETASPECTGTSKRNGAHQKDYRNPMLTTGISGEMTLRQFGTVSELLTKLRADLRLAFPSFVQEFIGDPLDGVTLLLELLRAIQLSQASNIAPNSQPSTSQNSGGTVGNTNSSGPIVRIPPAVQRRALLDELACLQCLHCCCLRYSDAVRRLTASSAGLFTLAVCIMSNVNKSRIMALELLTKACEPLGNGHSSVSEALSTLRLRFGEPVRFRFLVGMLTSGGQCELLTAGLKFLNTFLDTSGNTQRRLYIQAELEQAGFDIDVVKKIVNINSSTSDLVYVEIERWEKGHIDVESFNKKITEAEKENLNLKEKIALLERRVHILQEEKGVLVSLEQCLKERCCELQGEVTSLKSEKAQKKLYSRDSSIKIPGNTSPAEDEGISSSERSLSPDEQREPLVYELYNVQNETLRTPASKELQPKPSDTIKKLIPEDEEEETTIEEVIEELRNIINDAETEAYATEKKEAEERRIMEEAQIASKIQMRVDSNVLIEDDHFLETEAEIVPSNLHPQPPRRTRSLVHLYIPTEEYEYHQKEMYFENETQFMSDESSDSLLSASKCQILQPEIDKQIPININNNRELLNTIMDARDKAIQQEKRRQKKYEMMKALKRSESFQHMIPNVQLVDCENSKTVKQNSFDGLYFVTNFSSNTPTSTPHPKHKNKTPDDFAAAQKVKSKSLDRIDDGLDAMVDIIVTSEHQENSQQRLIEKSDSGVVTETTVSRSTSNLYSQVKKDPHTHSGKFSVHSQPKYEEKHRIFLPINKFENRDISETHFYFPRIQETSSNNFMIKRGHINAGLYSGQHVIRDSPANAKKPAMIPTHNYRTTLNRKNVIGKLTDLPSGLY